MKKLLLLLTLIIGISSLSNGQSELISYTKIRTYTTSDINALANAFFIPAGTIDYNYDIDTYKVLYNTINPKGDTVLASGVFMVPTGVTCALPTASYHHGTITAKESVPSRVTTEFFIGLFYATNGFHLAMADYIGLGDSEGLHPYIHSESEAQSVIDLLRAGKQIAAELGSPMSKDLFMLGYSQGGHVTAAAQRMIQENFPTEFNIAASNPMAGPYDTSGAQAEVLVKDEAFPTPAYLPYLLLAYNEIYDFLDYDLDEIFIAPYDSLLPIWFNGEMGLTEISDMLPPIPNNILQPAIFQAYKDEPDHPLRRALRDNDLMEWAPEAPTRLTYCRGDDQVTYLNSFNAFAAFKRNGSNSVELKNFGDLTHGGCARVALTSGIEFFNQYYEASNGIKITDTTITLASTPSSADGAINLSIIGGMGNLTFLWSDGQTTASASNLISGDYTLEVTDSVGCVATFSFTLEDEISTNTNDLNKASLKVYPNPASNQITIDLPSNQPYRLRILDMQGRLVQQQLGLNTDQLTIMLSAMSKGMYLVEVVQEEQSYVEKIVVQK